MNPMPKLGRGKRKKETGCGFSPLPPMESKSTGQSTAEETVRVGWREDKDGYIVGDCKGCGQTVRAMGLAPIPDRMLFGEMKEGGWYCSQCKPREFGKVGGKPSLAIPGMEVRG